MRFFDLHCDTAGECCRQNKDIFQNDLHIDLKRGAALGGWVQVFAIWIPDEYRGQKAVKYFDTAADYFYSRTGALGDAVQPFFSNAESSARYILAAEGGSAAGGDINGLEHLYERGVRILTLTWNGDNEIACGAYGSAGGMTDFGKKFVRRAQALGITADCSHLNRRSFYDLADIAEKPFIASHSNLDIVNTDEGRHRNLSPEQAKIIRDSGGLIGLNFYEKFLEDDRFKGIDALVRQIDAFMELGCENTLAVGSDYDGCTVPQGMGGIEKIPDIYAALKNRGCGEDILDKIFYENAARFFEPLKNGARPE